MFFEDGASPAQLRLLGGMTEGSDMIGGPLSFVKRFAFGISVYPSHLVSARVMPQRYATETRSAAGYRHLLQDLPWLKALLCCAFLGGGGAVPFLGASPIFSIAGFQQRLYRPSLPTLR